ncbi:MAG: hypothetical protein Q9166_007295 [cf. Caloplaca sp. 2 TL-2023]
MDNFFANWTEKTVMPNAPMIGTMACRPNEVWAQCFIRFAYGQQTIFTYIKTLITALLTTTGRSGALQSIYTSANAGAGASAALNPVDATLFQLLLQNGFSSQDTTFAGYMKQTPYTGNFTGATTDPPSDEIIYQGLVNLLQTRMAKIMGSWADFHSALGMGGIWMSKVQGAQDFVAKWTATTPVTATS